MATACEEFSVYRFVRDLFEDLCLTLPSLGCAFVGTATPSALTVCGEVQSLRNKLFLLFADLASRSPTLSVKFQPNRLGSDLEMDFLCTPFDASAIRTLPSWDANLFSVLTTGPGLALTLPAGSPQEVGPPIHWSELGQRYGGMANGKQVLDLFLERCQILLPALRAAIDSGQAPEVLRAAHTLKGTARGATAHALAEAALQLELAGRSGDLTAAPDLYKALTDTYDGLIRWVQEGQK